LRSNCRRPLPILHLQPIGPSIAIPNILKDLTEGSVIHRCAGVLKQRYIPTTFRSLVKMAPSAASNGISPTKDIELIINGVSRSSSTNTTFPVHNPLTGKFLYNAHSASSEDCEAAVDAAVTAFKEWKEWSPSRRRLLFYKAADLFDSPEWQAKIKERMSTETGANSNWIHPANTAGAAAHLREVGSIVTHIKGEVIPSEFPGTIHELLDLLRYNCNGNS
jgi:Aldehyde dehydrogenase family